MSLLRTSFLSILQCRCAYRLCYRSYQSSNLPELPEAGSGLPPAKIPSLPIPTIYDKYPHALQCYKYDGAYHLASVCGIKKLMLPFCVLVVSSAIMAEELDIVTKDELSCIALMAASLISTHFSITLPLRNFVGFLYVDQKTNESIVSYIDFWGRRVDNKFEQHDLYFKARGNILDKLYIYLNSRKTGEKFRINIRHASIYSQELLEKVVGKIPDTAF